MVEISSLLRKNIKSLVPYSSARDEYKGEEAVFMDANENPYNSPFNRYPDPSQMKLKIKISEIKQVPTSRIFLGNGSDEAIDLLIRAFCEPRKDNIIGIKPTYGMYRVCAEINDVEYREALLKKNFQPDTDALLGLADKNSKLMFLCSPNNPTSNSLNREDLILLINEFNGIVVLDEAYIDFSSAGSFLPELDKYSNLVVLQTFSKAWGMAGIRLGMAFARDEIIKIMNHIKYPYNVNVLTLRLAMEQLENREMKDKWIHMILEQRAVLQNELSLISSVKNILHSDANFLMVKFEDPRNVYEYLIGQKIIIRDRSNVALCKGYLRITVGTHDENAMLIRALKAYGQIHN
jgi:histidinol-phosphate aminotransferase